MSIRVPRLIGVVSIGALIGWSIVAPVVAYVAGRTEGYVLGLDEIQKVMHQEPPPAFPVFPPPPRYLKVGDVAEDPYGVRSGGRLEPVEMFGETLEMGRLSWPDALETVGRPRHL